MKATCCIAAIAFVGSTASATTINRRQTSPCPSGVVHFDAWPFAEVCNEEGVPPALMLNVPIGDPCVAIPAAEPLNIPFYAAVNHVGDGYDVTIYVDAACSQELASLQPNYQLGTCEGVTTALGVIQIVGSCPEGERDDLESVASDLPVASEEPVETCCPCVPEEISEVPEASVDPMNGMMRRQEGPEIGIPDIGECCACDADIPLIDGDEIIEASGLADEVSDIVTEILEGVTRETPDAVASAVEEIDDLV